MDDRQDKRFKNEHQKSCSTNFITNDKVSLKTTLHFPWHLPHSFAITACNKAVLNFMFPLPRNHIALPRSDHFSIQNIAKPSQKPKNRTKSAFTTIPQTGAKGEYLEPYRRHWGVSSVCGIAAATGLDWHWFELLSEIVGKTVSRKTAEIVRQQFVRISLH